MKNKIKIVSVLLTLSFLALPITSYAEGPVLSMAMNGDVVITTVVPLPVDSVLRAYCGNTNDEIGSVTLTTTGKYGPDNTSLPVNNCVGQNIYVQATFSGNITNKQTTGLAFASGIMQNYNINFTSSSAIPSAPLVPSNLTAVVDSQTTISLSWVDNSTNETRFEVYKDGVKLVNTAVDAVTYQATGLAAGTAYTFKVRAANGDQYSAYTSELTATTLAAAVNADTTSGVIASGDGDVLISVTEKANVNDSTTETVVKATRADALTDITIVTNIGTGGDALASITGSSDNIVVAKQSINLGKAGDAGTADTDFNDNAVNTVVVLETTVFVPTDTTTTAAKRTTVIIPELTLIKTLAEGNLASVEIRPPVLKDSTSTETAMLTYFGGATAQVDVKAAITIPISVAGIKFFAADGITARYIDICMDGSLFTAANASDVQVYDSSDGAVWEIDTDAINKKYIGDQFCFQTNHLSSFAGGQANSKTVACTQTGAPSNSTYSVANVTVTWNGTAWPTAAACSWACDTNYNLSGNTCVYAGSAVVGGGGGGGGGAPAPAVSMPTTSDGEVTVTRAGGGKTTLTTAESTKAIVRLPANSVSANTNITVVSVAKTAEAITTAVSAVPSGKSLVGGYVYDISAEKAGNAVTQFSKYVTITLTYKTSQIAGLKESTLAINYWDESDEKWVPLSTTVNKTSNTLTAKTMHFTYFAIIGEEGVDAPVTITRAYIREQMKNIIKQLIVLITELIKVYQAELLELKTQ